MTALVVTPVTLCMCRHILASHEGEQACNAAGCSCQRFSPGSRYSAHRYRRGQRTATKRVARLEPGDVVLVGYPGHNEYVRGRDGGIVWEQGPGELTSHPQVRHHEDLVLRPLTYKTGALLGYVTGKHMVPAEKPAGYRRSPGQMHVIETDLGELPPLFGSNAVLVLVDPPR